MDLNSIKARSKEERLDCYFKLLELPDNQQPPSAKEALGLTENDVYEYQARKEKEVSMKPTQKRDLAVRQVVRPLLKAAGFKGIRTDWWKELEDCWLFIHLKNSRFNSCVTGVNFSFQISVTKKEELRGELTEQWISNQGSDLDQFSFLPYCGYFAPYRSGNMYKLDGYRNYLPQDEPVDAILAQLREDFEEYILPRLSSLRTAEDWAALQAEAREREQEKEVRLLRYYHIACLLSCAVSNRPRLIAFQKEQELSPEDIVSHFDWLETIAQHSSHPAGRAKAYILETLGLPAEDRSLD